MPTQPKIPPSPRGWPEYLVHDMPDPFVQKHGVEVMGSYAHVHDVVTGRGFTPGVARVGWRVVRWPWSRRSRSRNHPVGVVDVTVRPTCTPGVCKES